jgi:hypothetical protein
MSKAASIAVFLGPTLSWKDARRLLDAHYFPPARKGDIYRIIPLGFRTIVLIDGLFHSDRSVWPRELLAAIDSGIRVVGAASMGALRAAELCNLGMQGHGSIFEAYRKGTIARDDEVAVTHASGKDHFRPLSEALINMRATLVRAVADGVVDQPRADVLLECAERLYYPNRTYEALLESAEARLWTDVAGPQLRIDAH